MDFRELSQAISQGIAQAFDQVHHIADRIVDDLLDKDFKIIGGIALVLVAIKLISSTRKRNLTNDRQREMAKNPRRPR